MGVRALLSVLVPGVLGILLVAGGLVAAGQARDEALVSLVARDVGVLEILTLPVAAALAANDAVRLDDVIDQWSRQDRAAGLQEVQVLDPHGRIVAHTDPTRFGSVAEGDFAWMALSATTTVVRLRGDDLELAVPARAGLRWGTVVARYDVGAARGAVDQNWLTLIVTACSLAVVGSVLLGVLLGRVVVRPVTKLQAAARAVASGDLAVRVAVSGGAELRELAESFNGMVGALAGQRDELERRVDERTSALQAANTRLERLADEDGLTGLLNHRRIQELIAGAVACGEVASVLLVDVDHFKQFNDTHGHPAGDGALRAVAAALRASTRPTDACARYGGEEFVVLLAGTPLAEAMPVAERVRLAVAGARDIVAPLTVSVGVAGGRASSAAELVASADQALYAAKQRGRNCVVVSDAEFA